MITYIIVDDEPLAHDLIEEFCSMLPHLILKQNCYNALEAMKFLHSSNVDIMFLDLNMPKLSGFEFLKTLTDPPKVIVTTAYKEFAWEGYELNVSDYLLKPFSFDRLVKAINKAVGELVEKEQRSLSSGSHQRFFVKGDKTYHQISSHEILFIEAYGNYTKLYFENEMIVSHESISHFEKTLSSVDFLRVHKSFLVALDKIKQVEGNRLKILDHIVPIGQTYKSGVSKLYNK